MQVQVLSVSTLSPTYNPTNTMPHYKVTLTYTKTVCVEDAENGKEAVDLAKEEIDNNYVIDSEDVTDTDYDQISADQLDKVKRECNAVAEGNFVEEDEDDTEPTT